MAKNIKSGACSSIDDACSVLSYKSVQDAQEMDTRKYSRQQIKTQLDELNSMIENCSIFHQSMIQTFSSKPPTLDSLHSFKDQLILGKTNIIQTYEQWRHMLGDIPPDLKTRNQIDQVLADNERLTKEIISYIEELSPPTATQTDSSYPPASKNAPQMAKQLSPSHSRTHSIARSSRSSASSQASSKVRFKQLEAKANVIAMRKKLAASKEAQELEQKAQLLARAIEQQKMKAELEAAEAVEQVYTQALEEEDSCSLFRPPSVTNLQLTKKPPTVSHHIDLSSSIPINHQEPTQHSTKPPQLEIQQALPKPDDDAIITLSPTPTVHQARLQSQTPTINQAPAPLTPAASVASSISDYQVFADTLAQAINTMKLKPAEPIVFYGDPLSYLDWKVAFEGLIESGRHSPLQKLAFLQQYLGGKAKEAVSGYFQIGTEEAYVDAKRKLDSRFGKPHVISEAYRTKLEQWPTIKEHDGEGLQKLADFLESCKTAMGKLPELQCLNDRRENVKILEKLPLSVGRRWVQKATQIEANTSIFPNLNDFSAFLNQEANVATNSLSEALAKRATSNRKTQEAVKKPARTILHAERKATTFLTREKTTKSNASAVKYPCLHCDLNNHTTGECIKLGKQDHQEIEQFFRKNNLCFSCAKPGHSSKKCMYPHKCKKKHCQKQHLTIFHDYYLPQNATTNENKETQEPKTPTSKVHTESKATQNKGANSATACHCTDPVKGKPAPVMSWTIPVYVSTIDNPNKEILVYALLDSGSNQTFITKNTLDKLNAKTYEQKVTVSTITDTNGTESIRERASGLLVRGYRCQKIIELPSCISQEVIPCNRDEVPNSLSVLDWPHLRRLAGELIPEREGKDIDIGLLIGANLPQAFISREDLAGKDHEPFARLTDLGWTLMGYTKTQTSDENVIVNMTVSQPLERKTISFKIKYNPSAELEEINEEDFESKILKLLSKDFVTTETDEINTMSIEDKQFLRIMSENLHKDCDNYITMPLPMKQKPDPNNKSKLMAIKRFTLLQKKLSDPTFSKHYNSFMQDIIAQGDAEQVPDPEVDKQDSWYLPHFGVYHPKKPGKIRVVFDGSAKVGGTCLNDHLLQGPDQLNSLVGILLRFRKEQVGIACDIGRMFHQFRVSPEHRDYLRFFWFNDQGEIATYRMKVHLFGATSSPACATFGLRALCDMSPNVNTSAKEFIKRDFYVDDGLISVPDSKSGKSLVFDAIAICKEGNLRLHKFASNSPEVLESLPKSERNIQDIQTLEPDVDSQPMERTLGLIWSLKPDSFQFSSGIKENPDTRRGILSTISSIYDPLGFLSPFVLQGKNILQEMCRLSASWDDPLTGDLLNKWVEWKSSLAHLPEVNVKRCYKPSNFGEIVKAEVHHFCDASTYGYGSVSYLRLVNTDNEVHCSFLMSKARVAPLKPITIPRLELQATVTAAKLAQLIRIELDMDVTETFWTDSQVALGYLKNTNKRFHVYVTNRIQQVRDNSNPEHWHHVPTSMNPADHASRGLTICQLLDTSCNWFSGPDFLWHEPLAIPNQPITEVDQDDPEVRSLYTGITPSSQLPTLYKLLQRYSSWNKVVKVLKVFTRKFRSLSKSPPHQNDAMIYIVKSSQLEHFSAELDALTANKPLNKQSSIYNLNPFLDKNRVLRVGGRLNHSSTLEFEEKHPIILPKQGHFTQLLLQHFHEQVAHQGRGLSLAKMRSSGFWIIGARSLMNTLIHKCVSCRLHRAMPSTPQMSSLPMERSSQSPPFTYCGIDCFGPFLVKDRRTDLKRYGLMVTCLASRAVHIEILDDMSTSSFINAIRNTIAIRGPIRELWCDQGTNFVGAIPELSKHGNLDFKLNPPTASHMGGAWERMIRTAKNVFQAVLKKHGGRLDTSGLRTLMYEVMAIINSRPLSVVTEENLPLSPNQLLTMKSDVILPPSDGFTEQDIYSRKRWRAVQHLANEFWKRWRGEYITTLQKRQKWVTTCDPIKEEQVVLIKDNNLPRNQWLIGKVVECIKSADGLIRSAKILLANKEGPENSNRYLIRPVTKLIKIL